MEPQFRIQEVLSTRKGCDEHGLVFKVQWTSSSQSAYIKFDIAKKKYPHIVLDYLVSRMKQKQFAGGKESQGQPKLTSVPPAIQKSDEPFAGNIEQKKQSQKTTGSKLDQFFAHCSLCDSKSTCVKMLDYDAIVPIESVMAYPVFLKLSKFNKKKSTIGEGRSRSKNKMTFAA